MAIAEESGEIFDLGFEEEFMPEIPEKINPIEKIYDFFSSYAPSADDVVFEQEALPIIDFFFVLSGYKKFSNDLKRGTIDIQTYLHNY